MNEETTIVDPADPIDPTIIDESADPAQDPLKVELEKIENNKGGKTKLEKALFAKKKIEESIAALSAEEGIDPPLDEEDDAPVTVSMLKARDLKAAQKTAMNLAEDIEDETERKLVIHHISNTIKPSGNPVEDLRHARAIVNEVKNKQIIEELGRNKKAPDTITGNGAPAPKPEDEFVATVEEAGFMKAPFNLSKEMIIANRKAEAQK